MRILFSFGLFAELVFASPPREALAPFVLYSELQMKAPGAIGGAIQKEVESLIGTTGWQIAWKGLQDQSETVSVTLAVVHFKGNCDLNDMTQYSVAHQLVLGSTYVSDGRIIPFADVYCGTIRVFLAEALESVNAKQREWIFGRAVGRVLAHELYHILANDRGHGAKGVAHANFTQRQLLSDEFRFSPKEVTKLRTRLVPVLLQAYDEPAKRESRVPTVFVSGGCSGCHGGAGEGTAWGPALRIAGGLTGNELSIRLSNPDLKMYRLAQELNLLWPRLQPEEIDQLAGFLQRLNN